MHMQKMLKKMHKKHRGHPHVPPPGMYHGMYGMWHHMMPKPHEMWPHMSHKPHKMWHHMKHKPHELGHHKMHPHMFHKMHHKMHKNHHHKKHHGRSSSSSSSSSSESEDESLVDGFGRVQIGNEQQGENPKENPDNETPASASDGDTCKEKFKCKRGKHFKLKGEYKKGRKCKWSFFEMMYGDTPNPQWRMQLTSMGVPPCRDPRYKKGIFHLAPPETSPNTQEERRVDTEQNAPEENSQQNQFGEVTDHEKLRASDKCSQKRHQRPGDSVDYFMQSIAEQIKKLPEAKIADAKLKILRIVNEIHLDTVVEQSSSAEGMSMENEPPQETQPEAQSAL